MVLIRSAPSGAYEFAQSFLGKIRKYIYLELWIKQCKRNGYTFRGGNHCQNWIASLLKSGLSKGKVFAPLGSKFFLFIVDHLNTYKLGNKATQIDFILFHRTMRKLVTDVKVIPGKEVALQHQLLVCNMRIDVPPKSKHKFTPHLKVWKLKDPQTSNHFQEVFNLHVSTSAGVADGATEDIWNNIKTGLLKTTEEVCGTTRPHGWRRETWWLNEHVEKAIAAKRKAFKAWKAGKGTRASYDAAKRNARHAVHHDRQEADKVYENIDPKSSEVYRLANQFRRENIDVSGDKPVKNDAGEMSLSEDS